MRFTHAHTETDIRIHTCTYFEICKPTYGYGAIGINDAFNYTQ